DAYTDAVQLLRLGLVRERLQLPTSIGRRRDRCLDRVAVAGYERLLELVERGAEAAECRNDLVGVAEEDVAPDRGVRAGEPRHLAQRRAGEGERLVPVRRRLGDAQHEHVGESVGEMA